MQSGQPVAYASRRTSQAEQNYAPIENETSATAFGCTRFHDDVCGQQLTVETDHKPLVGIFRKPLNKLKLLRCGLNVVWTPGKHMFIHENEPGQIHEEVVEINMVVSQLPISQGKLAELRTATPRDPVLLKNVATQICPTGSCDIICMLGPCFDFRDETVFCDGIMFLGNQIIVPKSFQN